MKHSRVIGMVALVLGIAFLYPAELSATVEKKFRYQGVLTNAAGQLLTGTYSLTFRLYAVPTGGTPLWSETQPTVPVEQGLFGVTLGSVTPFPSSVTFTQPYWLGIEIGTDGEMTPRQPLTAVPTAVLAAAAESMPPLYVVGTNVGIGTTSPTATLEVVGNVKLDSPTLVVDSANDLVGIGIATPASTNLPAIKVELADETGSTSDIAHRVAGGGWPVYNFAASRGSLPSPTPSLNNDKVGEVRFWGYDGSSYVPGATILARVDGSPSPGDMPTQLAFFTTPDGTPVPVERMRITNTGNVGIGTTNPSQKLEISGTSEPLIRVTHTGMSGSPSLEMGMNQGNNAAIFQATTGKDFKFYNGQYALTILGSNGSVGIGTTSPASRLDVAGGCISGSFCSDLSLKTNIAPLPAEPSYLDKVLQLQPVSFQWKDHADGPQQIGLIAQEVEQILPEVVTVPAADNGQRGLSCTGLEAVLIQAIKEQQQQIRSLEQRVRDLEGR